MKKTDRLFGELNHHAYCIAGRYSKGMIEDELAVCGIDIGPSNPDYIVTTVDVLNIDKARELKEKAYTMPVNSGSKKIFLTFCESATIEAQNALLKILEEPPVSSVFIFCIKNLSVLLPTVRSRVAIVHPRNAQIRNVTNGYEDLVDTFLGSNEKQRLDMAKTFAEEISKGKRGRADFIDFVHALNVRLRARGIKENISALQALSLCEKYGNDRAPSIKMLLEYVAMNV